MKCYLHIGTEKTATTTIQEFFNINRELLIEKGFIYTKSAGVTNNQAIPVLAYQKSRRDDFTKSNLIDSDEKLQSFQNKIITDLKEEIKRAKRENSVLVISSEHIQSRLTNKKDLYKLKEVLQQLGITSTKVIVYLRKPADIANSLFSTALKSGAVNLNEPPSASTPYWNNICNHKHTIEKFTLVFGANSVVPRIFEKNAFINNSIIDDILNIIGIQKSDDYKIPKNQNESVSELGIHLLRHLNISIPKWCNDKPNKARGNLSSYIVKHCSDSKYIMPNRLYDEYDKVFEKSNEWVRTQHFPNRKNLFSTNKPNNQNTLSNITEQDLERIVLIMSDIWNKM